MVAAIFSETQVSIVSSSNLATIGDKIFLTVIVKTTSGAQEVRIISEKKDFELISQESKEPRKQENFVVLEINLTISFFKTGDYDIGPFNVDLLKGDKTIETKTTNSIPITIKSVLEESDKDIKPIKELMEIKGNPFYVLKYVFVILFFVLAFILLIFWNKRRKSRIGAPLKPALSPVDEFDLKLKELKGLNLFEKGMIKEFFTRLSIIIKQFLFRKYKFNAEDFTSYETMYNLKRRENEVLILNNMEFLFNISDLVKFAKFIPDSSISCEVIEKIDDVILSYKKRFQAEEKPE